MTKTERCNQPCPREMPCIGEACQYYSMEYCYCDICKDDTPADYEWDGTHYCKDCMEKELDAEISKLSISEKIEALGFEGEIREV